MTPIVTAVQPAPDNLVYDYQLYASTKYTSPMQTPTDSNPPGKWSQQRRLRFIDFRLTWDGTLNRADLQRHFRISTPQASADIADYSKLAPENLEYDRSTRAYVASQSFRPVFASSGPRQYLTQLFAISAGIVEATESPLGFRPETLAVPVPTRAADETVLKQLLHAIASGHSLEVDYQSITRQEPRRRLISPHALAQDGLRWHVRAYCHVRKGYRDFVIGRLLAVHDKHLLKSDLPPDDEWNRELEVVLAPHPDLPKALQEGVAIDYKMVNGQANVSCRQALLFYLFKSLGLNAKGKPLPGIRQVVIMNLDALGPYLPEPGQP